MKSCRRDRCGWELDFTKEGLFLVPIVWAESWFYLPQKKENWFYVISRSKTSYVTHASGCKKNTIGSSTHTLLHSHAQSCFIEVKEMERVHMRWKDTPSVSFYPAYKISLKSNIVKFDQINSYEKIPTFTMLNQH